MNTKIIKFDINKNLYNTLIAKQGDTKSRFLLFNLLDGSIPFSLENRSVRVYAVKPDRTEVFNDLIITDAAKGYCILELTTQMLAVAGTVKLELMVIEEDKKLTSSIFYMDVKESINSEKAVVSTNEFGALLTALSSLNEYDNYKREIAAARDGEANLLTKVKKIDEQLDNNAKALKMDIDARALNKDLIVERNRIDNLSKLQEGSTTGDAEMVDARVGILGNVYNNLGDSIRQQINNIMCNNNFSFTKNVTGSGLIEIKKEVYKGQKITITLKGDENVLVSEAPLNIGYYDMDGTRHDNKAIIKDNSSTEFYATENIKGFAIWVPSSSFSSNGNITFTFSYPETLYTEINKNFDELNKQENLINQCFKFESGSNYYFYDNLYDIPVLQIYNIDGSVVCNYKKGEVVYLYLENDGSVNADTTFYFANTYENEDGTTEEIQNAIMLKFNTELKFEFPKNCTKLRWWVSKSNVIKDGTLKLNITSYRRNGFKNYFEETVSNLIGKVHDNSKLTFSILGDSYSAYPKWIEEGYASWFNDNGNTDTNNMTSFTQMWWYLLMQETGYSLLRNESYSGTTISTTGYSGVDSTATSFTTRMKKGIGEERTLEPKPNIIFVLGGQNDSWANSPIGSVKYSGWSTEDLKSTLPSFCYMIEYLKKWNPQARIINIINDGLKSEIITGMIEACNYYNVEYVQLTNITKENGHPNKQGMIDIKNQIIKIL